MPRQRSLRTETTEAAEVLERGGRLISETSGERRPTG
jgi:hypothetical protein